MGYFKNINEVADLCMQYGDQTRIDGGAALNAELVRRGFFLFEEGHHGPTKI